MITKKGNFIFYKRRIVGRCYPIPIVLERYKENYRERYPRGPKVYTISHTNEPFLNPDRININEFIEYVKQKAG